MKHPDEDINQTLDRLLRRIGDADTDQMEQRVGTVAQSLRSQIEHDRDVLDTYAHGVKTTAPRRRSRFAFVAALIVTLAIGVYAAQRNGLIHPVLPIQRVIGPQVAPAAQTQTVAVNPSRASEPTTTGALVGGSKEPVVPSGGGGALRTAAEEIAFLQSTDTGAGRLEFAAASVRRQRRVDGQPGIINCRGVDGELFPTPDFLRDALPPTPQGRCIVDGRIDAVIARAFSSSPIRANAVTCCISGVPDAFLQPPPFVIQATTEDPSRVTKAELKQMLQTLLIDRFKLKFHREMRDQDGYIMTIAKSGIKFRETLGAEQNPGLLSNMPVAERNQITQFGGLVPLVMKGNFSIAGIVKNLESSFLLKPVADKTGLAGVYEMTLNIQRLERPASAGPRSTGTPTAAEFVPPMPRAFEEQLGLHLEPGRVPVEYLIIEHIEMPSEN